MGFENPKKTQPKFRRIGAGACGTVWAAEYHGSSFKREDGGPHRSLLNDCHMHQHLWSCLKQFFAWKETETNLTIEEPPEIQIPMCHDYITAENGDWWNKNLDRFPEECKPCNMIHAQRIPPIAEKGRRLLAETFCPEGLVPEILATPENHDCLIRPYLGRCRVQQNTIPAGLRLKVFSLRNYPLHIDQMEEIGIREQNIIGYARTMAQALAVMHWAGEVDGNDVKFVLAAPNDKPDEKLELGNIYSNGLGDHEMWVLDFDLVRKMKMDEQGVKQAVDAFWKNDPFFPRPHGNPALWKAFCEQYLETSEQCISKVKDAAERRHLPALFIHEVKAGQRHSAGLLPYPN